MADRYRWYILCLAFLSLAVTYMIRMVYPPLIPEMSAALNLTHTEAGMLMSGFYIGYLAMQLPIGFVSDKIGVKRVHTSFMFLAGILCMLTGFATSFTDCFIYRLANGMAAGCIFAPGSALIMRWFPKKDRAIAMSLYTVASSVGTFIVLASSAAVSFIFGGWRWSFWLFSILAPIAAMLSLFLMKEKPKKSYEGEIVGVRESMNSHYSARPLLKDFRMWFLCSLALGNQSIYIGSLTWIPTYLVRVVGLTEVYAGSISSLVVIAGITGPPLAGFLADRIFMKKSPIIFFGAFASGLTCLLFSLLMPKTLYPTIVLFMLILFFSTMTWISFSLLPEWFPLNIMGTASGILNFNSIVGAVVGPFIFGYMIDLTGSFSLGWLILGSIATVSALPMLLFMVKEKISAII